MAGPPHPFILLQLPLIARDLTYDSLLIQTEFPCCCRRKDPKCEFALIEGITPGLPGKYGLHPAILSTNHQIHDEASRILYSKNLFKWTATGGTPQNLFEYPQQSREGFVAEAEKNFEQSPAWCRPVLPQKHLVQVTRLHLVLKCVAATHNVLQMPPVPRVWRQSCVAVGHTLVDTAERLKHNYLKEVKIEHEIQPVTHLQLDWHDPWLNRFRRHLEISVCGEEVLKRLAGPRVDKKLSIYGQAPRPFLEKVADIIRGRLDAGKERVVLRVRDPSDRLQGLPT